MANYMKEVAKMLGVELDKEFEVEIGDTVVKAKITDKDIYLLYSSPYWGRYNSSALLRQILRGQYTIRNNPWKPAYNEKYYSIGPGGVLEPGNWMNDFIDLALYKLGNCYRTSDEAAANRDKWISFYSEDKSIQI